VRRADCSAGDDNRRAGEGAGRATAEVRRKARELGQKKMDEPICAHAISVRAPMNCGVALTPSRRVSSSTIWPMEYQREDLRRWVGVLGRKGRRVEGGGWGMGDGREGRIGGFEGVGWG
jgi:hypothetical protein